MTTPPRFARSPNPWNAVPCTACGALVGDQCHNEDGTFALTHEERKHLHAQRFPLDPLHAAAMESIFAKRQAD